MTVQVAAVDLGASSGRVVLGEVGPGVLRAEAVSRFANDPVQLPDGLHWNVLELYRRALEGLTTAQRRSGGLTSVGVDSWAVDYGLLRHGHLLGMPFHYRDERCRLGVDSVHSVVPPADLYRRNGLQVLPFNTLYQLAADPLVSLADELLLVPDLIGSWLTGVSVAERTNASTTGLLDVHTRDWDRGLAEVLGVPDRLLGRLVDPGEEIGTVLAHVADQVGAPGLVVTAVGSHDTASAVVGVPIQSDDAAYISCGTWGLVGVELEAPVVSEEGRAENFTNEGGVDGRVRYLTNVMGLWLLSETLRAWERAGETATLASLLAAAGEMRPTRVVFDVQDPAFLPPGDMPARIARWYAEAGHEPPTSKAALVRAIVDSLAQAFADAVDLAAALARRTVGVVHVVGGGALNTLLCQAIADRSGRPVVAGPVEATALGNLVVQARASGAVGGDLDSLRALIAATQDLVRFEPRPRRMVG